MSCTCHNDNFYGDEEEESDFECPECGEELDEDDVCQNEECPNFGDEVIDSGSSHAEEAAWERRQMGITS